MKYTVTVNGAEIVVDIDGENARVDDSSVRARLAEVDGGPERILMLANDVHRIFVRPGDTRGKYTLWVDGFRFDVEALDERSHAIRELSASTAAPKGPAPLVAPMPGMIVRINVAEGDVIHAGQGLVVMEAMKMENELRATSGGAVRRVLVTPGTAVEKGALLLEME
ncbi:MAG TPA: biotin/lipoyl-containing protein [Gemmatimonadaceae bacterium]|nr:biotin/lipoyl-containing protein [Gemmatimonadaceae bacterium]